VRHKGAASKDLWRHRRTATRCDRHRLYFQMCIVYSGSMKAIQKKHMEQIDADNIVSKQVEELEKD
jgi:hypothetical protein